MWRGRRLHVGFRTFKETPLCEFPGSGDHSGGCRQAVLKFSKSAAQAAPQTGQGWVHEPKLDGWRLIAEVKAGKLWLWSRGGLDWAVRLPELEGLAALGDAVLDGELVAATSDGRADFELLSARRLRAFDRIGAVFYAFDILSLGGRELLTQPWERPREVLESLDLGGKTGGHARLTADSTDGETMHRATAEAGNRRDRFQAQRGRLPSRTLEVLGQGEALSHGTFRRAGSGVPRRSLTRRSCSWGRATRRLERPSWPSRTPNGLPLPNSPSATGARQSRGLFRLPLGCLSATVLYTSRTQREASREAMVISIAPSGEPARSCRSPFDLWAPLPARRARSGRRARTP